MPVIWIIGDSTVEDNRPPFRGWGWALPKYLLDTVPVRNLALSGRSTRSFWDQGLFSLAEQGMQKGDILLIQFGHNDEKDTPDLHTDPDSTYPEFLMRYCNIAREKGALPVLMTPVSRRFFVGGGSLLYTHGEYPRAVRELAAREQIPLCDLKKDSRALYISLGEEATAALFVRLAPGEHPDFPEGHDDKTHFNAGGATIIAGLVAKELRSIPECAVLLKDENEFPHTERA